MACQAVFDVAVSGNGGYDDSLTSRENERNLRIAPGEIIAGPSPPAGWEFAIVEDEEAAG